MTDTPAGPNTPSMVQQTAVKVAAKVRTLVAGTDAMRAAGLTYLPKWPAEDLESHKIRVASTVLFNATGKTVKDMTGKVFVKPVTLEKDVPADLVTYAENIDLTGRHINVFAKDVFFDAMQTGVGFIYVEAPPAIKRDDGSTASLADYKAAKWRPYLTYIPLENLLGWKSTTVNGAEVLTQIRILELVTEPDGEFLEKQVPQVRVVEPGSWRTYRESTTTGGVWNKVAEGTIEGPSGIPLVTVYINRIGFMTARPPLNDLADLNITHWQSSSDQRNILHVTRVPILFAAGWGDEDKIEVGAGSMVRHSSPDAKLGYVEHSGAAIGAGDKDLQNLEFQMQTMGLQLLVPQPGGKSATGEIRDDAKENSPLAMMARGLQDALEQAFGFMAEFMGLGADKGGSLVVNTDFGVQAGAGDLQQILDAAKSGVISKETAWSELQRRGFLSDSFDPAVEKDRQANETPELDAGPGKGMNLDDPPPPAAK